MPHGPSWSNRETQRHRVFVLYAWKDKDFAIPLVAQLRRRGFDVAIDRDEIVPGDLIAHRIIDLIESSESIIFIVSPESISSPWCKWEIAAMQQRDKRVIPVLFKGVEQDAVPGYLSHLNYLVMTDPRDATAFDALVRTLHAGRGLSWSQRGDRIFLSYRRSDTEHAAGRIYDYLEQEFGKDNLFFDTEDIEFGDDFRGSIKQAMVQSRVLVAVAGKQWFRRRHLLVSWVASREIDWVRVELELAIDLNVKIIPLMVDGVTMPSRGALAKSLSQISYLNAAPIRAGRDFRADISRIISRIRVLREAPAIPETNYAP